MSCNMMTLQLGGPYRIRALVVLAFRSVTFATHSRIFQFAHKIGVYHIVCIAAATSDDLNVAIA